MRRRLACVMPSNSSDCGVSALATVALHYGLRVRLERLRELLGSDLQGTSLLALQEAAEALGFSASCGRAKTNALDQIPLPAIAHFNDTAAGHLVVVHQVNASTVVIADPAKGISTLSRENFMARWSNHVLLLSPAPGFCVSSSRSPLLGVLKIALKEPRTILFSVALAFIVIGLGFAMSFCVQIILDRVVPRSDVRLLTLLGIGALLVIGFRFVGMAARQLLLAQLGYRVETSLGLRYTHHVLSLPLEFFDKRTTGDIFGRMNDVSNISGAVSGSLMSALPDMFFLVLSALILMWYSLKLTLLLASFLPAIIAAMLLFLRPLIHREREIRERTSEWANRFIETMQNIKIWKAFASEAFAYERIKDVYLEAHSRSRERTMLAGLLGAVCTLLTNIASIALLWNGTQLVMHGHLTMGQLVFFYSTTGLFLGSVDRLSPAISSLQEASVGVDRMNEICELDTEETLKSAVKELPIAPEGTIELRGVTFWHRSRSPVLSNLDLKIENGEWIAILGETGSGKSTLANVVAGLYQARSGEVFVGGISVTELLPQSLRQQVAVVFQDAGLMNGTIRENIAVGKSEASLEEIREAARVAHLDDFVMGLPRQYDYKIGAFGSLLSSGQRQRVAIARAILRNTSILILDEATSNLDIHTEQEILKAIQAKRHKQTTILITHRVLTSLLADTIALLDSGRIVERGTHLDLIEKRGKYYGMWQAFGYVDNNNPSTLRNAHVIVSAFKGTQ